MFVPVFQDKGSLIYTSHDVFMDKITCNDWSIHNDRSIHNDVIPWDIFPLYYWPSMCRISCFCGFTTQRLVMETFRFPCQAFQKKKEKKKLKISVKQVVGELVSLGIVHPKNYAYVLCFVVVKLEFRCTHNLQGYFMIAPVPVEQPWRIWVIISHIGTTMW